MCLFNMLDILNAFKRSAIEISNILRYENVFSLENIVSSNKSGDNVKKLDIVANTIIINNLKKCPEIKHICSEENEDIITTNTNNKNSKYLVSFDPLDGSSNIGVNITVGTIFAIFEYKNNKLLSGNDIVMAGYFLYGSSFQLAVIENKQLNFYIVDKNNKYNVTKKNHTIPYIGNQYAINQSNEDRIINPKISKLLLELKKNRSQRWVGSLVADAHRILIKGGIFMYPLDYKFPFGKIRLLYEAYPMAYIFKYSNGYSSNEIINILDIPFPKNIHQKTSILLYGLKEKELIENESIN